ncbi:hypothetical protein RND81_01G111300 [Saponaria officinalis]|uniref:Uncharacterized protein n=1 Tax=Saponaria officinalis TaxID=3572 RepID=A0AAW1ND56_SAPOF
METSLRYSGEVKCLVLHAKQKLAIDSETFLQVRAELDTKYGGPSYFSAMLRRFYNPSQLAASLGLGVQFDKSEKLGYVVRGKTGFPVLSDGSVKFNVKGRCDVDKDLKQRKSKGAAEFSWSVLNFQKDQDVRVKVGYDIIEKVPYMQIRENNWTVNADATGRWNIRYDL